ANHRRGIVRRNVVFEHPRRTGSAQPARENHVLHGDGHARERARIFARGDFLIHGTRGVQRPFGSECQVSVGFGILRLGEFERFASDLLRAALLTKKYCPDRINSARHFSITRGTLKYPCPATGAFARASAFPSGLRSTSTRRVAVSSASKSTCDIGSTCEVSSSLNLPMWVRIPSISWVMRTISSSVRA